jgi:hypothetical protein
MNQGLPHAQLGAHVFRSGTGSVTLPFNGATSVSYNIHSIDVHNEREDGGTFENLTGGLIGGGDETGDSAFRATVRYKKIFTFELVSSIRTIDKQALLAGD